MNVYTDGETPAFSCWRRLFWLSSRGYTFDQLLSFAMFRAAGSRPYGILLEFVRRIVTHAIVVYDCVQKLPLRGNAVNLRI